MFTSSYRKNSPRVPTGINEVWDFLGHMMLAAPTFRDSSGYFPYRNVETQFQSLNEGLKTVRSDVGEETYQKLVALSDRMRAHFEADPESKNGEVIKGRELILDMQDILKASRKRQAR